MKLFPLLISLFCFTVSINAQLIIKATLIDVDTKAAIPYANIGIVETNKGTVSDDKGNFELAYSSKGNVVTISTIGYQTFSKKINEIIDNDTLELERKDYKMEVVEIEASRFKAEEVQLGVKNKTRGHSIAFGSPQLGTEIGAPIRIRQPTYIKSVNFVLNHAKGDSLLFRVNIYAFNNGEIGENLLTENIFIKQAQRKGTITVDMMKYNLILKSDVLLTLEWLRNFDELGSKGITFDTKKGKKPNGIYTKFSSNGAFTVLPFNKKKKPCFYFIGKEIESE